jgi:hypothetical protein
MRRLVPLAEHPFELLFGLMAFLSGLGLTLGAVAPVSLDATLPPSVVWAWGGIQLLAGALIVVGIVVRYLRPALLIVGFRLEQAGLWPLAAVAAVYGAVAVGYAGTRALYPAGVLVAVAAACVARAIAVARLERTIRKHTFGGST